MGSFFIFLISFGARFFISLRYKVIIRGLKEVRQKMAKTDSAIFAVNHTAHIDPIITIAWLWPIFKLRPLLAEFIARFPILGKAVPWIRGVCIPEFDVSVNQYKIKKGERAIEEVLEGLRGGDRFLIFPSGKLKMDGKERLGGASSIHTLLEKNPTMPIVLIRISGFWGSIFSKAFTGKTPDFFQTFKQGFKILLKNGIFFAPRRTIYIDMEFNPEGLPRKANRRDLNLFLENWFNRYPDDEGNVQETEPLKLIHYYFYSKKLPQIPPKKRASLAEIDPEKTKEVEQKIFKELRKILENPNLTPRLDQTLGQDLGMDSLAIAEAIAFIAKNYSLVDINFNDVQTVEDLIRLALGGLKENGEREFPSFAWPFEKNRPDPIVPMGDTLAESFLLICDKMGSFAAMGDDVTGLISYKRCKKAVLVLAEHFKQIEEKNVATLFPPSIGSTLVILALIFAKKIPVPVNWTLGPRYLEQMMEIASAKKVISSFRFLDKVSLVDFGSLVDQISLIEDIRKSISLKSKLKGAFLSLLPAKWILKWNRLDPDMPTVILFTSGSEVAPKGVPLSHKNILTSVRHTICHFEGLLTQKDVMEHVLPQFHSFGFSISTFVPLLSGMRSAYYPNPLDGFGMAESIGRWQATLLPIVPNFLKKLFQVAHLKQLASVRFFLLAGEKTPQELFDKVRALGTDAVLLEGYGLSETSPIVSCMRVGYEPKGVGQVVPNVEVCAIDPETHTLLPSGSEGLLCVRGANVFHGYLGGIASPFIEIEGKQWFKTGDIGYVDTDETIYLTGRLKRFVKIGGEMISLKAVEDALIAGCKKQNKIQGEETSLALCAEEKVAEGARLILFTTFALDTTEANEMLKDEGFSNLIKISKTEQVDEIPLMGTGKVNYRQLESSLV